MGRKIAGRLGQGDLGDIGEDVASIHFATALGEARDFAPAVAIQGIVEKDAVVGPGGLEQFVEPELRTRQVALIGRPEPCLLAERR